MKKCLLFSFFLLSLLTEKNVFAQKNSKTATIWFLRNKSLIGSILECNVKVGNQKPFSLYVGQSAKFTVFSKGRVVITTNIAGRTQEEWLEVEPGKDYFYKININKKKYLSLVELPEKEDWTNSPKHTLEEDSKYPINEKE